MVNLMEPFMNINVTNLQNTFFAPVLEGSRCNSRIGAVYRLLALCA